MPSSRSSPSLSFAPASFPLQESPVEVGSPQFPFHTGYLGRFSKRVGVLSQAEPGVCINTISQVLLGTSPPWEQTPRFSFLLPTGLHPSLLSYFLENSIFRELGTQAFP